MVTHDKKMGGFTRDVSPPVPKKEVWHTFEEHVGKILFFHKGHILVDFRTRTFCGYSLNDVISSATEGARSTAVVYEVDGDSALQILVVGATYHYDLRLVRYADPRDRFDHNHYDGGFYNQNRRLVMGPVVGWSSSPDLTALPSSLAERFEEL